MVSTGGKSVCAEKRRVQERDKGNLEQVSEREERVVQSFSLIDGVQYDIKVIELNLLNVPLKVAGYLRRLVSLSSRRASSTGSLL